MQLLRVGGRAEPRRLREPPEGHEEAPAVRGHLPAPAEAARDGNPEWRDPDRRPEPGDPGSAIGADDRSGQETYLAG